MEIETITNDMIKSVNTKFKGEKTPNNESLANPELKDYIPCCVCDFGFNEYCMKRSTVKITLKDGREPIYLCAEHWREFNHQKFIFR